MFFFCVIPRFYQIKTLFTRTTLRTVGDDVRQNIAYVWILIAEKTKAYDIRQKLKNSYSFYKKYIPSYLAIRQKGCESLESDMKDLSFVFAPHSCFSHARADVILSFRANVVSDQS